MKIEETKKILLGGLIPGAPIALITYFLNFWKDKPPFIHIGITIVMYAIAVLIVYLLGSGWLKSRINLWNIGKIRGLWQEKGLIKQIQENFTSSNIIKVKVTRAYDLLQPQNKYGFYNILEDLKDGKGKKHSDKVDIRFLLMVPCFQEEHVRQRYERHTNISEDEFLETWYKFLLQIRTYNTEHLSVNVRFYFGSHARWRFYIFSKPNAAGTNVFLSEYERGEQGCSEPMYKIIKGEQNIGTFMSDYFDEIWKAALTPQMLYQYISNGRCKNGFCSHCTRKAKRDCVVCDRPKCNYEEICKRFMNVYKPVLNSFNAR